MITKYGYSQEIWDRAKKEVRGILIEVAKASKTILYSELVNKIKTIQLEPDSYALANMLGEISSSEDNAGRGMLSAVVVNKETGRPGPGFFDLAKGRGRSVSDVEECWINELNKVYSI